MHDDNFGSLHPAVIMFRRSARLPKVLEQRAAGLSELYCIPLGLAHALLPSLVLVTNTGISCFSASPNLIVFLDNVAEKDNPQV